ncbi:hypothetical protein C2I18_04800 [Paenibacillus sp. PK3_47]|uniref:hypothetical protein n=1 Tax=Paenibacillus sp. PK3_47 TaxID=2072642 RepID=UPI00201DAE54|nr:hypothetical protein [Paenibacillus sp. PK3_47]UQZ32937.1 hypothetical protein C2I18_04800 [Paenibacillus sp. PK3_47]
MSSLIYIAVVIIIGIISSMNKASKAKGKTTPRGGMPTFGGGGEAGPLRRTARKEQDRDGKGSGFPDPAGNPSGTLRSENRGEEGEYEAAPPWRESPFSPSPDYETGEGLSLEQADERDGGIQARTEAMQRELEQIEAAFDGMAGADRSVRDHAGEYDSLKGSDRKSAAASAARSGLTASRQDLQNGLVWAEILGPPRARQPHPTRRGSV